MIKVLHIDGNMEHHSWLKAQIDKLTDKVRLELGSPSSIEKELQAVKPDLVLTDDQIFHGKDSGSRDFSLPADLDIPCIVLTDNDLLDTNAYPDTSKGHHEQVKVPFGSPEILLDTIFELYEKSDAGALSEKQLFNTEAVTDRADVKALIDENLTRREREILFQISRGLNNKDIAVELDVSYRTVVNHVYSIYSKLDIHSRAEAIRVSLRYNEENDV